MRALPWLVALAHGLNDSYGSFLSALLPLVIEKLDLSLAMAGLLASVRTAAASFTQPLAGTLADRFGERWFVVLSPAITCTAMSLLGIVPNYLLLAFLLLSAGLGTAAFHPAGAALAGSGGGGKGFSMSVFSAGGTIGAALGPLLVAALVSRWGLRATPFLLLPAWVSIIALNLSLPRGRRSSAGVRGRIRGHPHAGQLLRLWAIGVFRSLTGIAYANFLAVLWVRRGASLTTGGLALTTFSLAGALGGIVAGKVSDRFGRKTVIVASLLVSLPFFYLFLTTRGAVSLAALALAGFFLMASNPVSVALAQEMFPEHQGTVSGVLLGLAWGIGSLLISLVGYLGDILGLERALGLVNLLIVPGALLSFGLREPTGRTSRSA